MEKTEERVYRDGSTRRDSSRFVRRTLPYISGPLRNHRRASKCLSMLIVVKRRTKTVNDFTYFRSCKARSGMVDSGSSVFIREYMATN